MSDNEYACYEIKLNRLFSIQAKQNLIYLTILLAVCVLLTVVQIFNSNSDPKAIIISYCICAFLIVIKILSEPKCLDVTPDTIKFQYHRTLLRIFSSRKIDFQGSDEYTIYNIEKIEYNQSAFEKIFSVGHIIIYGDVNTKAIKENRVFAIYGVKDFKNTSEWMKEYINISK